MTATRKLSLSGPSRGHTSRSPKYGKAAAHALIRPDTRHLPKISLKAKMATRISSTAPASVPRRLINPEGHENSPPPAAVPCHRRGGGGAGWPLCTLLAALKIESVCSPTLSSLPAVDSSTVGRAQRGSRCVGVAARSPLHAPVDRPRWARRGNESCRGAHGRRWVSQGTGSRSGRGNNTVLGGVGGGGWGGCGEERGVTNLSRCSGSVVTSIAAERHHRSLFRARSWTADSSIRDASP
ncbi:unnamed protein product [Lampetra fluviatilis]